MAEHTSASGQPVMVAQAITVLVGLAAGALGVTLNDATVTLIATVAWLLISATVTVVAHSRVTPLAGGWKAEVRDIVEQVVQDVVSTQLNLTGAIAPSGQPTYVPASPPPAAPPAAPSPGQRTTTPPQDPASRAERASRWTRSPLRQDSGDTATMPQPRP